MLWGRLARERGPRRFVDYLLFEGGWHRFIRRASTEAERLSCAAMPLLGVTLTATGVARLEARPPQLALSDVGDVDRGRELEPGRPVRLLDERDATLAIGVADPENELLRVWSYGDDARAPDAAFVRARLAAAFDLRRTLGSRRR